MSEHAFVSEDFSNQNNFLKTTVINFCEPEQLVYLALYLS